MKRPAVIYCFSLPPSFPHFTCVLIHSVFWDIFHLHPLCCAADFFLCFPRALLTLRSAHGVMDAWGLMASWNSVMSPPHLPCPPSKPPTATNSAPRHSPCMCPLWSCVGISLEYMSKSEVAESSHAPHGMCMCLKVKVLVTQRVPLFVTPWAVARQASLCMGFTGKNTGVDCHFLLQGIFLTQGSNPCLVSPALAGGFFTTAPPAKPLHPRQFLCLSFFPLSHSFSQFSFLVPEKLMCLWEVLSAKVCRCLILSLWDCVSFCPHSWWWVYSFLLLRRQMTTVSDLRQHSFVISQFWRSDVWNVSRSLKSVRHQGCVPSGSVSLPFPMIPANSLLPCKVIYSQISRIWVWTSLGATQAAIVAR